MAKAKKAEKKCPRCQELEELLQTTVATNEVLKRRVAKFESAEETRRKEDQDLMIAITSRPL